jgi:thiosulfate/3-mercaptopyruvate sulfurtransferase
VYDDGRSMTSARVWWQLWLYGHPDPAVLCGGWAAWQAAGGQQELYEPCPLKVGGPCLA